MITNNSDQIAKELQDYSKEVERKLRNMVAGFAGEVALKASQNTAVASPELVERWEGIYRNREDQLGIDMRPGYHAGAWQYTEGTVVFDPAIRSQTMVEQQAEGEAKAQYKLGDKFGIAATGPNFDYLEDRDRIGANTVSSAVMAAYSANLVLHYNQG